ncbi:MAG: endonuclease/exonuclease/phosphatase family protein, partial [Saprospiraceae bacterium]|nr:endonuclease/exonuclease/phosphatase family protein [Saprospiraceae bacterium]
LLSSCGLFKKKDLTEIHASMRVATYNTSLFQRNEGGLIEKLSNDKDTQAMQVARVIRHIRPDIILLQEFDYDKGGTALDLFRTNFLTNLALGADTIQYRYGMAFPSNTGVVSELDINGDGKVKAPADAFGFGYFEGQYGFVILSRYPFDSAFIRTFQQFLWADMPGAAMPLDTTGQPYYEKEVWQQLRLSSKNHVDLTVSLPKGEMLHLLLSHPTPPVFDGPEDRNGCRNHDEIRLWKDYIHDASYLVDDKGIAGGLKAGSHFVIMGDMNADPLDGDSKDRAILQLLEDKKVHQGVAGGNLVPSSEGGKMYNRRKNDKGDPSWDTSFFGLRVDYVLPDAGSKIKASGVFWPVTGSNELEIKKGAPSDHLLVWIDMELP